MRTTTQHLADVLLDEPVETWIAARRAEGTRWHRLPDALAEATGGRVLVTERTLRNWLSAQGVAA